MAAWDVLGDAERSLLAPQLPWGARGSLVGTTWVFSPTPCTRAALGAQHPWVSLQELILLGLDSAPVFRALHILLMTYGLSGGLCQEVGWILFRETWILIEKPSFIQSKERKKNKTQQQQNSCNACRQAPLRYK